MAKANKASSGNTSATNNITHEQFVDAVTKAGYPQLAELAAKYVKN